MAITFNNEVALNYINFNHNGGWSSTYGSDLTYDYFADGSVVNDATYFTSYFKKYGGLKFYIGVPLVATSISVVWEYYDYPSWKLLLGVSDGTNAFQNSGEQFVTWTMPDDWTNNNTLPGGASTTRGYNIRCRIASVSGLTEGGAQTTQSTRMNSWAIHISTNTHTLAEVFAADVSGGWGVVTRDASEKCYLFDCNLIADSGIFFISDHEVLVVGKSYGRDGDHFAIEVGTSGTLQLGELSVKGFGYNGATLIWNNGHNYGYYLYWRGNIKMYQSKFWMYGYKYIGLSFGCVLDIVDCVWSSDGNHTWYLTPSSGGRFVRTTIGCYYLYVYSGTLSFTDMNLTHEADGSLINGVLAGYGNYFAKISGMDFQDSLKCVVTQRASMALIDCDNFQDSQASRSGNYTTPEHIHRRFNFLVKVLDEYGNNIENATIQLLDTDGRSALFEEMRMITGLENVYITDLDSIIDTSARTSPANSTDNFAVGDILRVRGEILEVYSITDGTHMVVLRSQAGTTLTGVLGKSHSPYKRRESVLTNSDGEVFYDTDINFQITVKDFPRYNNVNYPTKDFNPFTLIVNKNGFQTYKQEFTINKKTDLTISLKPAIVQVDQERLAG